MEWIEIFTFMGVAALLVMSPGPNGFLIAQTVPISGKGAGFANIGGFVSAFYLHGTLSIFGISVLLMQSAQAFFVFKMLGAAYLGWIGLKSLIAAWRHEAVTVRPKAQLRPVSLRRAFMEGFLTNALNPKVSLFYLAAFPQFISGSQDMASAFTLVSLHAMINLLWFSAMVMLLVRVKDLTGRSHFLRWLKGITGLVFIGFSAKLAAFRP